MIACIALGLATNPAPEHRWRRVAVPVAAVVFILLVLAGTSIVVMLHHEAERAEQRTPLLASNPSPTDLFVIGRFDSWQDRQYSVIWIQPASNAPPVLPPGISTLPKPGQAVISPALDRLTKHYPSLAARYPDHLVLGSEGIRSGDELFAYVRAQADRDLASSNRAVRVGGFGKPTNPHSDTGIGLPSQESSIGIGAGVLGFLIVPGLIVLAVGVASASSLRDRRFEILRWIGAPRGTLITLSLLETAILALPCLVVAVIFWAIMAPRLQRVPLAGYAVVGGDLGLPWWLLLLELFTGIAVTLLVATLISTVRRKATKVRPRPDSGRSGITPLRLIPLALGLVMLVAGQIVPVQLGGILSVVGIVLIIAGIPLILPSVLHAIGKDMVQIGLILPFITGRGLEWDPIRIARPFAGAAALVVIALTGSGYLVLLHSTGPQSLPRGTSPVVVVQWVVPRADDPARLASALGRGLVVPVGVSEDGNTLVMGATCPQISPYFGRPKCNPKNPYTLPDATTQRVVNSAVVIAGPGMKARLVPRQDLVSSGSALVLDSLPLKQLDERVRSVAMQVLPAPTVYSWLSFVLHEPPLVAWIVGGIIVALIVLTIGCLASLIDRLLSTRGYYRYLLNVGIALRRLMYLEMWMFAAPYVAIAVISSCVGLIVCWLIVRSIGAGMPWQTVGVILGAEGIAGLIGTLSVALFSVRSFREDPERVIEPQEVAAV